MLVGMECVEKCLPYPWMTQQSGTLGFSRHAPGCFKLCDLRLQPFDKWTRAGNEPPVMNDLRAQRFAMQASAAPLFAAAYAFPPPTACEVMHCPGNHVTLTPRNRGSVSPALPRAH